MIQDIAPLLRPASYPYSGRLVVMPTTGTDPDEINSDELLAINFPAMPDSIELARSAEYQVLSNMILPDGIHQYKGTRPLEIPFSFRLHAYDSAYCPNGAYTLLQLAARLHSFIVPIDKSGGKLSITGSILRPKAGKTDGKSDAELEVKAQVPDGTLDFQQFGGDRVFNPVTLRLELIYTEEEGPGISCIGYVREVSAKLNGPWLKGPGKSYNLPSSGDFSFTFVHRPGHSNRLNIESTDLDTQPQAYADLIHQSLFNTRRLAEKNYAGNYQGLAASDLLIDLNVAEGPADSSGSRIRN